MVMRCDAIFRFNRVTSRRFCPSNKASRLRQSMGRRDPLTPVVAFLKHGCLARVTVADRARSGTRYATNRALPSQTSLLVTPVTSNYTTATFKQPLLSFLSNYTARIRGSGKIIPAWIDKGSLNKQPTTSGSRSIMSTSGCPSNGATLSSLVL